MRICVILVTFLSLAWLAALSPAQAQAQAQAVSSYADLVQFARLIPDLPVPYGWSEADTEGWSFDQPHGRVVEVVLVRRLAESRPGLADFYQLVLPQLGWEALPHNVWEREFETLELVPLAKSADRPTAPDRWLIRLSPVVPSGSKGN